MEASAMNASDLMSKTVFTCHPNDSLQQAMQLMWEHDCGIVPVLDDSDRLVGMITDRDVAVAAYTRGQALWQIPVSAAMAKQVHAVRESDDVDVVEALMRRIRVRRVPVLDGGSTLKGILSLNDIARHAHGGGSRTDGLRATSVVQTLAAIGEPRLASEPKPAKAAAPLAQLRA
jgi:CBS domain-containing protein